MYVVGESGAQSTFVKTGSSVFASNGHTALISSAITGNIFEGYGGASGNTENFVIQNNGNVGIGTTSPTSQLQIGSQIGTSNGFSFSASGAGTNNGIVALQNTNTGGYEGANMFDSSGALSALFAFGNSTAASPYTNNLVIGTRKSGGQTVLISGAGVEAMRIDTNGNVGIGTTSPTASLFIQGTSTTPILSVITSTTAQSLYVANNGNVGIGTNNPTDKLTVFQGNLQVSNGYGIHFGSTSNAIGLYGNGTNNTIGINTTTPQDALQVQDNSSLDAFDVASTSGSSFFHITNAGNVGIGTTTPSAYLDIAQEASSTASTRYPLQLGSKALTSPSANGTYLALNAAAGFTGNLINLQNNGTNEFIVQSNGSTTIGSLGAGCVNSTASGALYVNTCGGGASLSGGVNGENAYWTSPTTLAASGDFFDNGVVSGINATSSTVTFNIQGTGSNTIFNVASSSGSSILSVLPNGNVGVATTSPTANLDVQGSFYLWN